MRYFNDMSIDEIADAMNCSHSTIKRRLVKGKKLLEKLLKKKIRWEAIGLNKNATLVFHPDNSSLNNTEHTDIPELDTQTANQLLGNVFAACDMEPSVVPGRSPGILGKL